MSLDHDDYATLVRIEDHLRRIADALERPRTDRLPELVDIAQRGLDRVAASFRLDRSPDDSRLAMQQLATDLRAALDVKPCDDRTCTERSHWAPKCNPGDLRPGERRWDDCETRGPNQCEPGCVRPSLHDGDCRGSVEGSGDAEPSLIVQTGFGEGRIAHGAGQQCIHGKDHPDVLACEYLCAAAMPGHWCTRREHADDRHVWAMSDEEAQRILRAGRELGFIAEPDPLDESDDRPRHISDREHLWRHGPKHWHTWPFESEAEQCKGKCETTLDIWQESPGARLTFCDCPDTIEAENGATD